MSHAHVPCTDPFLPTGRCGMTRRGGRHLERQPAGRVPVSGILARHLRDSRPSIVTTGVITDEAPRYAWLQPPSDAEKLSYIATGQHRWIFVASALAFLGVVVSFAGLAAQSYWTAVFFVPLLMLAVEQACSLRTSTLRRR